MYTKPSLAGGGRLARLLTRVPVEGGGGGRGGGGGAGGEGRGGGATPWGRTMAMWGVCVCVHVCVHMCAHL